MGFNTGWSPPSKTREVGDYSNGSCRLVALRVGAETMESSRWLVVGDVNVRNEPRIILP